MKKNRSNLWVHIQSSEPNSCSANKPKRSFMLNGTKTKLKSHAKYDIAHFKVKNHHQNRLHETNKKQNESLCLVIHRLSKIKVYTSWL